MCGTVLEDLWEEGMPMAGSGDVKVTDAGDGSGGGHRCSVKPRTRPGVCHKMRGTLQEGGGGCASVRCIKRGAKSVRI